MVFIKDRLKPNNRVVFNFSFEGTTLADTMQDNGVHRQMEVEILGDITTTSAATALNAYCAECGYSIPTITIDMITL